MFMRRDDPAAGPVCVCPVCAADDTVVDAKAAAIVRPYFDRAVRRCRKCRHGFIDPPYDAAELGKIYGEHYFELMAPTVGFAGGESEAPKNVRRKIDRLWELVRGDEDSGRRLLEIGCGHGHLLAYARSVGFDVVGVEFSDDSAAFARKNAGLEVLAGNGTALPELPRGVDAVVMHHVLEHFVDPESVLRGVAAALRPSGRLLVDVPNELDCLAFRIAHAAAPARFVRYPVPTPHVHFFNRRTLSTVLARNGFAVDSMRTYRISMARGMSPVLRVALGAVYVAEKLTGSSGNIEVFARRVASA